MEPNRDVFGKICVPLVMAIAFSMMAISWVGVSAQSSMSMPAPTSGRPNPVPLLAYKESSMGLSSKLESGNLEFKPADLNMDGNVDLMSIGDHGSAAGADEVGIMVWFNDGTAKWTKYQDPNAGFGYGGIAYGDINNDGKWDVAYAMHHNYDSKDVGDQLIEASLGDGTGKSWTAWDDGLATNGEAWGYFGTDVGDFNNDGYLDIVSNSFSGGQGVHVYKNNQNGNWTMTGNLQGWSHNKVMFADVNADGNLDVVAHKDVGKVYLGDGKGGWTNKDGGLPSSYDGVKSADVNNDGYSDLSEIKFWDNDNKSAPEVYIWDNGAQSWTPSSTGLPDTSSSQELQGFETNWFADMNNDGNMDLVSSGYYGIYIFTGDGTGKWTLAGNISPDADSKGGQWDTRELKVGDFDHNGFYDIIAVVNSLSTNWINIPHVYLNDAPATQLAMYLQYPRGGERFFPGSTRFIDYTYSSPGGAGSVKLELSTTGNSGPWTTLVDNHKDGARYQWTVPNTPSKNCFIKATITAGGNTASGMNLRPFEIIGSGGPAPVSIQVNSPAGGENWTVASQQDVTWSLSGGTAPFDVTLEYSVTGPSGPWKPITSKSGAGTGPGTYSWTVPNDPSTDAFARASVKDSAQQTSNSASRGKFTIYAPANLPVLQRVSIDPSAAVTLAIGGKQTFNAKAYDDKGAELKPATLGWTTAGGIGTLSMPSGASSTFTATTSGTGGVKVTATYNGKSVTNSTQVTVAPPGAVLYKITISPASVSGDIGRSYTLVAKATDTNGTDITDRVSFVWSIALPNLADLSQSGKSASITLKNAGETTITVTGTYNGLSKSATASVKITKPQTEFPWWIIYALIAIVVVIFVLMFILGRRKKKQNPYDWAGPGMYW